MPPKIFKRSKTRLAEAEQRADAAEAAKSDLQAENERLAAENAAKRSRIAQQVSTVRSITAAAFEDDLTQIGRKGSARRHDQELRSQRKAVYEQNYRAFGGPIEASIDKAKDRLSALTSQHGFNDDEGTARKMGELGEVLSSSRVAKPISLGSSGDSEIQLEVGYQRFLEDNTTSYFARISAKDRTTPLANKTLGELHVGHETRIYSQATGVDYAYPNGEPPKPGHKTPVYKVWDVSYDAHRFTKDAMGITATDGDIQAQLSQRDQALMAFDTLYSFAEVATGVQVNEIDPNEVSAAIGFVTRTEIGPVETQP